MTKARENLVVNVLLLLKIIPLATRVKNKETIDKICSELGIAEDLFVDQRKAPIGLHGMTLWELKRRDLKRYWINIRGSEFDDTFTLAEAAVAMRTSEAAIKQLVSANRVYRKTMIANIPGVNDSCDDIVTCSKMTDEEIAVHAKQLDHQIAESVMRRTPPKDPPQAKSRYRRIF